MFPDKKSLEDCWAKGTPDEVRNLRVGYILTSFCATANVVESGQAVNNALATFTHQAVLGL